MNAVRTNSPPKDFIAAYTVAFDLNGYRSDGPSPQTVTAADPSCETVIDGMCFNDWYTEQTCEISFRPLHR